MGDGLEKRVITAAIESTEPLPSRSTPMLDTVAAAICKRTGFKHCGLNAMPIVLQAIPYYADVACQNRQLYRVEHDGMG